MKIEFIKACKAGKLEEAKKIFGKINKNDIKIFDIAFNKAFENNKLEIAKWLYSLNLNDNIYLNLICDTIFHNEYKNKNSEVIKFLGDIDNKFNIHANNEEAFRIACNREDLDSAKWLYSLDGKIDIHVNNEEVFRIACNREDLESAKWLYSLDGKIDIHVNNEEAFIIACRKEDLESAKWLYSLDGKIDIHVNNEEAFRNVCNKGYLDSAKWLYSLDGKIDIRYNDDEVFKYICKHRFIYKYNELIIWLSILCDDYFIEYNSNGYIYNIKIINDLEKLYKNNEYDKIIERLRIQKENFKIDSDNKCLICYDDNYNFISSCKHTFCLECFLMWYIKCNKLDCSYCRQNIVIKDCIYQTN